MRHVIEVTLSEAKKVSAIPNPLEEVQPGDTVVWSFVPSEVGNGLQIGFLGVQVLAGGEELQESEPNQPFAFPLAQEAGKLVGVVRADVVRGRRFKYGFFGGDGQIAWAEKMEDIHDFGGLDIPPPPPRG